ncbi:MAG: oligosaccharide flippase family protein [Thalassovita sp.]
MIGTVLNRLRRGGSLTDRAMRSSAIHSMGFVLNQALRLGSNLILTRILFPEAFGLMALVTVVMVGLAMFSDVGVSPAIMQSKRGDDPDFLNTAWTIQMMRGAALWAVAALLAYPAALLYEEPQLLYVLPVYGVTLLISGFNPTKMETANRHLQAGRVTTITLAVQFIGLVIAVLAAWITQSVWSLVISGISAAVIQVVFLNKFLPGPANRFQWEKPAAKELIHFGKWIFLSTICGFITLHSDKLVIGKYLSLDEFGVYNIGYFLASFPMLLGGMVTHKVLIPIYRENPPDASRENFLRLRKMRVFATALLLVMTFAVSLLGVWLIDILYDARYARAGAVVVVLSLVQIPQIIVMTYDQAALAAGNSRGFFVLAAVRAVCIFAGLIIGLETMGLLGALLGLGAAYIAAYPVVIWLSRQQGAWDPLHDAVAIGVSFLLAAIAFQFHIAEILTLTG